MGGFKVICSEGERRDFEDKGKALRNEARLRTEDRLRDHLMDGARRGDLMLLKKRLEAEVYWRDELLRLEAARSREDYLKKIARLRGNYLREIAHLLVKVRDTAHIVEEARWLDETLAWTIFECSFKTYWYRSRPDNDMWEGTLQFDGFRLLLKEHKIDFPSITKEEIDDRSKGDALSKGIALLQITWFIIQLIARRVQGLTITELELTTAALAGLNSVMYLFWWSKPLGVQFPIVIRTKEVEKMLAERPVAGLNWKFESRPFKLGNYVSHEYVLLQRLEIV